MDAACGNKFCCKQKKLSSKKFTNLLFQYRDREGQSKNVALLHNRPSIRTSRFGSQNIDIVHVFENALSKALCFSR